MGGDTETFGGANLARVQSRSMASRKPRSSRRRSIGQFDPERFLASTRLPKRIRDYKRGTVIYAQTEAEVEAKAGAATT